MTEQPKLPQFTQDGLVHDVKNIEAKEALCGEPIGKYARNGAASGAQPCQDCKREKAKLMESF